MARINRSKYNFTNLKVGDTLTVKAIDLHSMKVALNFFNNLHRVPEELMSREDIEQDKGYIKMNVVEEVNGIVTVKRIL